VSRGGLLYIEETSRRSGNTTSTPLVPVDPSLGTSDFHIYRNGLKTPVEFELRDDGGIDLFLGRYCFHKVE
jgi:hypothetical protein